MHAEQLVEDPVVHSHLSALYDTLLEQNLIRLIEPFSCVQIKHLASLIKLPLETVLSKLAQVPRTALACPVTICQWYQCSKDLPCIVSVCVRCHGSIILP